MEIKRQTEQKRTEVAHSKRAELVHLSSGIGIGLSSLERIKKAGERVKVMSLTTDINMVRGCQ